MLHRFLKPDPARDTAIKLHGAIAERARSPVFYARLGVPDTIDGRFDLLVLHVFFVMETLKTGGKRTEGLATHLATVTFEGFEDALRDLGVGDIGLSRRIKAMADAFYGRLENYASSKNSAPLMAAALLRNLYRGDETRQDEASRMAEYAAAVLRGLAGAGPITTLQAGRADFGPLPE